MRGKIRQLPVDGILVSFHKTCSSQPLGRVYWPLDVLPNNWYLLDPTWEQVLPSSSWWVPLLGTCKIILSSVYSLLAGFSFRDGFPSGEEWKSWEWHVLESFGTDYEGLFCHDRCWDHKVMEIVDPLDLLSQVIITYISQIIWWDVWCSFGHVEGYWGFLLISVLCQFRNNLFNSFIDMFMYA